MAVTPGSSSGTNDGGTDVTALIWAHTIASGEDLLAVGLSVRDTGIGAELSGTFNGDALTLHQSKDHSDADTIGGHLLHRIAPDVVAANISLSWTTGCRASAGAHSPSGANQTTPYRDTQTAETATGGAAISDTVASSADDLVLGVPTFQRKDTSPVDDADQTERWDQESPGGDGAASHVRGIGSTKAGAATSQTIGWTYTSVANNRAVQITVSIQPAAGGDITGSGALVAQAAVVDGAGVGESAGSGTLEAQAALVDATGASESSGTGTLAAQAAVVDGAGTVTAESITGSGALAAGSALVSGAGLSASEGAGALVSDAAMVQGAGAGESAGSGALVAQAGQVAGTGEGASVGTGALQAAAATVEGEGDVPVEAIAGAGTLVAAAAVLTGAGVTASTGAGTLAAQGATVVALGEVAWFASGALQAQSGVVAGEGTVLSVGLGALVAGAALVGGEGEAVGAPVPPAVLRIVPGTHRTPRLVAGAHRTPRLVPGEHRP